MFNLPSIVVYRTAWTLNDIVSGVMKATHICYVMQYGSVPVYGITELATGRTKKFRGSVELIRKLYTRKVLVKVLITTAFKGYQDDLLAEDREKLVNSQVDGEIKLPDPVANKSKSNENNATTSIPA